MASSRLAKLWLSALLLTVVLSTAATAATTTLATTDDDAVDNAATDEGMKDGGMKNDGATGDGATSDGTTGDGATGDGTTGDGATGDGATGDGATQVEDDSEAEDGEVPTGGSAGADADASAGDDVEEDVDDASAEADDAADTTGDVGDEGKAGTGKRSVGDSLNSFKDKAGNKWEETKKKLKSMFEESKKKAKNAVAGWSDKIKDKLNGLNEDTKAKIMEGNGLSEEVIAKLNKGQLRMLVPMNQVAGLNATLQDKVYQRFKTLNDGQSMRRVLESMDVADRSALITKISEVNGKLGSDEMAKKRLVMSMVDKLGDPREWTAAEVDMMKSKMVLKYIPPGRLMMLNETAIINKVSIPTNMDSMKPATRKAWTNFRIYKKTMAKQVSEWTAADINADIKASLGTVPMDTLKMIKNASLYDAFSSAPAASTKIEPAQGKLLAKKLMSEFKKRSEANPITPAQVKSFASGKLGKLSMFMQPKDLVELVDSTMQDRDSEIKDMLRNTFANKKAARGKRCDVFKRTEKGKNLASYTTAQVTTLVNDGSLGCVPLKYLNMWIKDEKLTFDKLSADALSPGQMRAMAQAASGMADYKKTGGGLNLATLPASLMSAAAPSDIKATDWNNLRNKISAAGAAKLDKPQRAMVVFKGTPAQVVDAGLGAEYTELVPVVDLKAMTAAKKKMAAMAAPPDSPLRMLSAAEPETALPEAITASNANKMYQPGLPFLDAKMVAASISTDEIQGVLEQLRKEEDKDSDRSGSGGMSPALCMVMKKALANATQLLYKDGDDDASILGTMSGAELGSLPPCIVGRMWHKTVGDKATAGQKMGILSSLSQVKPTQLKMMDKRNCHGLVRQALSDMKSTGDLTVTEAGTIGMAATCMDGKDIKRLDMQAFDALRMYFQDGCFDKSQADAVVDQLIKYYGLPKDWTSLEPMCGLLPLMDDSRLREIPETRLAAACGPGSGAGGRGKEGMQRFEKTAQMICSRQVSNADHKQLMERRMNVGRRVARGIMMAQKELMDALNTTEPAAATSDAAAAAPVASGRRRRAAEPTLTCAMVQEGAEGAEPWTSAQLKEMAADEAKKCQKALGSKMVHKDKLNAIWSKLKEANSDDAGEVPMKDIGFVAAVIPVDDIKKLDLSNYDAVSAVGQPMMMMSKEQLMELAKRAKSEFSGLAGEATDYISENLIAAGQIICGMEADDVAKIPDAQLKPAMKKLSDVSWCPSAVTEKLATKFLALNGGNLTTLGKAEVAEMGAMIGGLEAMDLKKIANESMAGLTAVGMMSIPPNKIAMLTRYQVSQLSPAAAYSVSDAQKSKMSEEVKTALQEVIETRKPTQGGAEHVTASLLPLLLLALAVTRLA